MRAVPQSGGGEAGYPLQALASDGVERDLAAGGVMTLNGAPGTGRAALRLAPSVHVPTSPPDPIAKARSRLQSTLPFQLFVGQLPADAVTVTVPPNEEDPSRFDLALTMRWPEFQSLPGAGEVELRWPLQA